MATALRQALDRRDITAIIDALDEQPHLDRGDADVVDAWAFIEPTPHAPAFARTLLRALEASAAAMRVAPGWVASTGLAIAQRALEAVDDADGPSCIYGALLAHDVLDDTALDHWIEQAAWADGYFYPESLSKAHDDDLQPDAPPQRLQLLRAIEALVSFSYNVTQIPREEALEYLARALRSERRPISDEALAEAATRLQPHENLRPPRAQELAAARET